MWESQVEWRVETPLGDLVFDPALIRARDAWAHLTKVGSALAAVRTIDKLPTADGSRVGDAFTESRILTMEGVCRAVSQAYLQPEAQKIRGWVNSLMRADGLVKWHPSGFPALQMTVRRYDQPDVDRGRGLRKDMLLSLIAGDPRVYSQALQEVSVSPAPNLGFTSPFTSPIVMAGTGADQTFTNDGDAESPPIIDIYGPTSGGAQMINATTGEAITFLSTLSVGDGDFVRIDVAEDTVWLNGLEVGDMYRYIDSVNTDMWMLQPGVNDLRLIMQGTGLNSHAVVKGRDAWMP